MNVSRYRSFLILWAWILFGHYGFSAPTTTVELGWVTAPVDPLGPVVVDFANDVTISLDGSIILVGPHGPSSLATDIRFAALQLIPTGTGVTPGWATSISGPFGPFSVDEANAVAVDSEGNAILVGTHTPAGPGPTQFAALQLIPNLSGGVDLGWATALNNPFGSSAEDMANGMVIRPDDTIILVGSHDPSGPGPRRFAALQLIPSGLGGITLGWATAPDQPFGSSDGDVANSVAIDTQGAFVLVGEHNPSGPDALRFAALQLMPNLSGGVDLGWTTALSGPFGPSDGDVARGIAIDKEGNSILAGRHRPSGEPNRFAALQLIPFGTFVKPGWATAPDQPFGPTNLDEANGVEIDSYNNVILAGVHTSAGSRRFAALQLVPDGSGNVNLGWVTAPFNPFGPPDIFGYQANGMVIDQEENPILAGYYDPVGAVRFAALQLIQNTPPEQLAEVLALPFIILAAT